MGQQRDKLQTLKQRRRQDEGGKVELNETGPISGVGLLVEQSRCPEAEAKPKACCTGGCGFKLVGLSREEEVITGAMPAPLRRKKKQ